MIEQRTSQLELQTGNEDGSSNRFVFMVRYTPFPFQTGTAALTISLSFFALPVVAVLTRPTLPLFFSLNNFVTITIPIPITIQLKFANWLVQPQNRVNCHMKDIFRLFFS